MVTCCRCGLNAAEWVLSLGVVSHGDLYVCNDCEPVFGIVWQRDLLCGEILEPQWHLL